MASANEMVEKGVGIVIAITVTGLMAAFLLPVALSELTGVDTTGWSDGASAIFEILDLIIVLVLFLVMVGWAVTSYRAN